MITFTKRISLLIISSTYIFASSCSSSNTAPNTLTETEKSEGWELLFNGQDLTNWHLYNTPNFKGAWYVENGAIKANPDEQGKRADLVSNNDYENYELQFEWKLAKEGNSGIFINVFEHDSLSTAWMSGPEYQLLEDSHPDFDKPLKKAGTLYAFTPQKNLANTKLAGEWNQSRIVQEDGVIKFYLNDVLTAEMDFNTSQWKKAITQTSFKDKPEFGVRTKGKIALQDWANGVSFRSIKIREI